MPDINIDTTNQQYQQKLSMLATIRSDVLGRIQIFKDLPKAQRREWLECDPLMKNTLRFCRSLVFHLGDLGLDD